MSDYVNIDFQVTVYDVVVDGEELDFTADLDNDGDIRIEVKKESVEEFIRNNYTDEEIISTFNLVI